MQDEASRNLARGDDRLDQAVLALLLADPARLWAVDELAREIADDVGMTDSLARLYGVGLVHRIDEFVFATRAATRATELAT